MKDPLRAFLPYLQEAACRSSMSDPEYLTLRRNTSRSSQALWNTFSKKQRKLFLTFEADNNAQSAAEEEHLILQALQLARKLYQ